MPRRIKIVHEVLEKPFILSTRFWRSPSFEQTWFPFTQGCLVPSLVKTLKLNIFWLLCLMPLEKMWSLLIFLSHCQSEKKTSSPETFFLTRATFQQIIQGYWEVKKYFKDQQDDLDLWPAYQAFTVPSLATFELRGRKKQLHVLSSHLYKYQQFDLTFDHVTWKSIGNFYSLGSSNLAIFNQGVKMYWADIDWSTDRPSGAKQDAFFIQRGAWKYIDENIYILG